MHLFPSSSFLGLPCWLFSRDRTYPKGVPLFRDVCLSIQKSQLVDTQYRSRRGQCSVGRFSTETPSSGAIGKWSRNTGASHIPHMGFPRAALQAGGLLPGFWSSFLLRPGEPRVNQLPEAPLHMTLSGVIGICPILMSTRQAQLSLAVTYS